MRKILGKQIQLILALLTALALLAVACGSDGTTDEATAETSESQDSDSSAEADEEAMDDTEAAEGDADFSDFKVVMILDGSSEDGGWNTTHLRAGNKMADAFPGIDFSYVEEIEPGQPATNAFQDAVDSGADLVIGTTFYQFDFIDVADANPDVHFLSWGGFEPQPNVNHYDALQEDGRYLDGIVAGSLTESGLIGYPVGFPFDGPNRAINAFTLGAREVNPDAEVQVVYLNTWFDPAIEQQAAEALANAGADVLAHEAGAQVYATVMADRGGYVIGNSNDWSDFEPEAWASSFLYDWSPYYIEQVQAVMDGTFEPGNSTGGLAAGWIEFAPYGPAVTQETLDLIEERKQGIIDGTFDMFAGPLLDNQGNEVVPEGGTIALDERYLCCQYLIEGTIGEIPSAE